MRRVVVLVVLAHASVAAADSSVVVTLNAQGEQLASDLGLSVADIIATARTGIDELY